MPYSRRDIASLLVTPGVAAGLKVATTVAVSKMVARAKRDANK